MSTKNKKVGRPSKDSELLRFRADREIIDGLDAAIAADPEKQSRPEGIRRILREWLVEHGYLKAQCRAEIEIEKR